MTTWVAMVVLEVMIAVYGVMIPLEDEAAGSGPQGMSRAIKLLEWEGVGIEDLRVLTTRTNSQTANGVS